MSHDEKIDLSDSVMDIIFKMSQGNPGAATVIGKLLASSGDDKAEQAKNFLLLLHLDDMGMRGGQIWEAFKHCNNDLDVFKTAVKTRDRAMVAAVNSKFQNRTAVAMGASFK